ncbi:thymidylate kinase [Diplocarpon mali]|nr:thymidylate kinase [Diplocarpon mali]
MIDSYLQSTMEMDDHVIHLLFSANRWEKAKWIETSLASGYTIVCDRYYYSGMVYSAAKHNPALSLTWAQTPDVGLPRPDIVVFLDLQAEEAEKRGGFGEEKYENKEMQQRVRELFLSLLEADGDEKDMKIIDAGATAEIVGERIWGQLETIVNSARDGTFGKEIGRVKAWRRPS